MIPKTSSSNILLMLFLEVTPSLYWSVSTFVLRIPYFLGVDNLNREQTISRALSVIHTHHRDLSMFVFASSPLKAIFLTWTICACLLSICPQAFLFNCNLQKPVAWQHQRACVKACVNVQVCVCVATAPLSLPFLQAPQCIYRCCILCAWSNK